jgi:hypothetical protein
MFDTRGSLRTCLLLLLVGTLTLPLQPAVARWPDPPPVGGAPTADDDLADGVHLRDYLPTGQAAIASSDVSGDQGPHTWRPLKTRLVPRPLLQPSEDSANQPTRSAVTCTVSSTSDSGPNTLRQCLLDAVAGDVILFDPSTFPPGTPMTITLASDLPWIYVDNLTIDASEAGVILDGSGLASDSHGLVIAGVQGVTLRGLQIKGFYLGVLLGWGATNNTVGGDRAIGTGPLGQGNLISGNSYVGVQLQEPETANNSIIGNFIGTDLTGNSANGNDTAGIIVGWGASHNVIGGPRSPGVCDGPCNVISGNVDLGVLIADDGTTGNQVLGNFMGTNISGGAALPNNQGIVLGLDATDTQVGGAGAGEGNLISGNTNFGIWISSAGTTGNQLLGNLIGTDITGMTAVPNYHGILISESTANLVGGAAAGAGNLVSGNEYRGIWMEYLGTPGNTIAGNKIGTNLTGTGAVPNYSGITQVAASYNLIGGTEPGAGNLISGNAQEGLHFGNNSNLNSVLGNTIGTDVTGEVAIPNMVDGVFIGFGASNNTIGGVDPGGGNLISGNGFSGSGVFIQDETSIGNQVLGNRIGTNRAGSSSLPNGNGVTVVGALETMIGGADTGTPWVCDGSCNLISGNGGFGVSIQGVSADIPGQTSLGETARLLLAGQNNQVLGNFIGTDLTGASALPNLAGVDLSFSAIGNLIGGSNLLGEGNLTSGNQMDGIVVRHPLTSNNHISGNRIGTTADGESALPNGYNGVYINEGASGNTVGGEGAGLGNLISGQATDPLWFGVYITTYSEPDSLDNQVIGNLIGTNRTGKSAIPNGGGVGVADLVTGTVIRDNVISGNSLRGILIMESTGNQVRDNNIGVAVDGLSPLPNKFGIILVTAPHNIIGASNTIAYNQVGIAIGHPESVGNTITQNGIYANTDEQIDFFEVPQPLAPAPNLTGWDGETVSGTACAGCQVEVFANPGPQPAGHTYLGTTTAAGDGTFSLTAGPGYRYLAATATDAEGTTSEFSTSLFIGTTSYVYLPLIVKAPGPLH